jgi:hypothetical protein
MCSVNNRLYRWRLGSPLNVCGAAGRACGSRSGWCWLWSAIGGGTVLPTYNTYVTHTYYFSALIIRLVGLVVSFFLKPWSQARGCQEVQKVDCVGVSRASDVMVVMTFLLWLFGWQGMGRRDHGIGGSLSKTSLRSR